MTFWLSILLCAVILVVLLIGWALCAINRQPTEEEGWREFDDEVQRLLAQPEAAFDSNADARDYLQRARESGAI